MNGISGALIIKEAEPAHAQHYDFDLPEHVIFLQDWMHVDAEFVLPGLTSRLTGQPSDSLLINGQGTATVGRVRGDGLRDGLGAAMRRPG